jgi:hypothetical protein
MRLFVLLNLALWIVCVAQLVYVPLWARSLGRSGALWFLVTVAWAGGWAFSGGIASLYFGFLETMAVNAPRYLGERPVTPVFSYLCLLSGAASLLPTLVLAIAGASRPRPRPLRVARRRRHARRMRVNLSAQR